MQKPATNSEITKAVTCPFCGLLCDDLIIERKQQQLSVKANGCAKASVGFEQATGKISPRVDGNEVGLDEAITKAVSVIKRARHPLFGGLATDVSGARSVMQLADRTGGVVDHMLSEGMMRNFYAFQGNGWIMTTLTEIKNRADLVVFAGTDASNHPRFFERYIWNKFALCDGLPANRQLVFLGRGLDSKSAANPKAKKPTLIRCDPKYLGEVMGTLRALAGGTKVQAETVGSVKTTELQRLAKRMKAAKYGVLVWEPATLTMPYAELTVQTICDLVKDLNVEGRFAGFSLGGDEGAMTAANVCAWQSGYPLRTSFHQGYPEYIPSEYSSDKLLSIGQADLFLWVASFASGRQPPRTRVPTIVLGESNIKLNQEPAVYIPVGTPGIDHKGTLMRCDSVVSLRLKQLRQSDLPSVATVVNRIYQAL